MIELNEAEKWGELCYICGKPVRYWHDQVSESDDFVTTTWHRRCAKDYKEWFHKVTHILPEKPTNVYVPKSIRWDNYLDNYHRRILGLGDKIRPNKE